MLAKLLAGSAAAAVRATPTFVSSSITNSSNAGNTVTAPTGIQNGDLLVAVGVINGDQSITPATGFNVISIDRSTNNSFFIATKVASSESGNYTFTWGSALANTVAILVYRDATFVNTVGTIARASSTNVISASSITPTYTGTLVCAFSKSGASSIASAPSGLTQRALQTASGPVFAIYDLSGQPASATSASSITFAGGTTSDLSAIQFFVTNEPNVLPEFVASASRQNPSTGATLVVNKPTGTIEGDLMIGFMCREGSSGQTWTGDTGWTEVADQGVSPNARIAYKTAGASEPSSYTFTCSNSTGTLSGSILTYRYAAYDTIAAGFTTGANPLVLPSVSPTLSQSLLLTFGSRNAASITLGTPTSMTARVTDADATAPSYKVCDQTVAKGPTGTRSMSTGSTSDVSGIMLAIKPTRSL